MSLLSGRARMVENSKYGSERAPGGQLPGATRQRSATDRREYSNKPTTRLIIDTQQTTRMLATVCAALVWGGHAPALACILKERALG